jgi:hypothetical protein
LTQERLIKLIDNPELLASISLEELKTLAFAYPYAHNLRYLLALKAEQTQHPDAQRFLQAAAAYSIDRRQLFMLVMPQKLTPIPVAVADKEAVLELKPIESIKKELEALAPQARNTELNAASIEISVPENVPAPTNPLETFSAKPNPFPQPEINLQVPELEIVAPTPPVPEPVIEVPEPVEFTPAVPQIPENQSFADWFVQFNPPSLVVEKQLYPPPMRKIKPLPAVKKEPVLTGLAQALAEKSLAERETVISETLARLLVQQGHKEKAINMYQRLSLAFPEKSAYFAAEIDKLKK